MCDRVLALHRGHKDTGYRSGVWVIDCDPALTVSPCVSVDKGNTIAIIVRVEPSGNPQANAGPESPKKGTLTTVQHQLSSVAAAGGVANGVGAAAASGPSGLSASSTAAQATTTSTPANVAGQNGGGLEATSSPPTTTTQRNNSPSQIPTSSAAEMTMAPTATTTTTGGDQATQLGRSIKQVAI